MKRMSRTDAEWQTNWGKRICPDKGCSLFACPNSSAYLRSLRSLAANRTRGPTSEIRSQERFFRIY